MKTEVRLHKIDPVTYFSLFGQERLTAADYYVRHGTDHLQICQITACGLTEAAAGFLLASVREREAEVHYIYVFPEYRGRGVAAQAILRLEEQGDAELVTFRLPETLRYFFTMKKILEGLKYVQIEKVHLFGSTKDTEASWRAYLESHGNRVTAWLEDRGFYSIPYAEAGEDLRRALAEQARQGLYSPMDPRFLTGGRQGELLEELSWLACRGNVPAAYSFVIRADRKNVVCEQIAACRSCQDQGVVFLAFARMVDSFYASGYERMGYAVYETNPRALALSRRMFRRIRSTEKLQYHYEKRAAAGGRMPETAPF